MSNEVARPALIGPVEGPDAHVDRSNDPSALEPLTAREKEMLLFEHQVWRFSGAKETAIRARWDISATRYYQIQNEIISKNAALKWDPITVKRLRRRRAMSPVFRSRA